MAKEEYFDTVIGEFVDQFVMADPDKEAVQHNKTQGSLTGHVHSDHDYAKQDIPHHESGARTNDNTDRVRYKYVCLFLSGIYAVVTMTSCNLHKIICKIIKATKAEVMVTNFLVQHNLLIATADHLGPLFKAIFPDGKIGSQYASARTKTSAILNYAMRPHCHETLVEHCKSHPFALGTDGSNDSGLLKMNPVTIRLFDIACSKKVISHFYDICTTSGKNLWQSLFNIRCHK